MELLTTLQPMLALLQLSGDITVVGVGIAVTATFFVYSPPHDAAAEVAPADKVSTASRQPEFPVAAGKIDKAIHRQNQREEQQKKDAGKRVVRKPVVDVTAYIRDRCLIVGLPVVRPCTARGSGSLRPRGGRT